GTMTTTSPMRTEQDSLGPRRVPADAHYGAHTSRSIETFRLSGTPLPIEIIHGMALLKLACARANARLGLLPPGKESAIVDACRAVLSGAHDREFPIDLYQAGSGTSSHMNLNEVLASLANESLGGTRGGKAPVHPNDDVNMGQSTNNCFPSGAKIAVLGQALLLADALAALEKNLRARAAEFAAVLKSGRTHLQDAVPVTLGQEFGAWAHAVRCAAERIREAAEHLKELGIGGNAVGTGINTKPAFRSYIIDALNEETGGAFRSARDGIALTQFLTDFAHVSAAFRSCALDVQQIASNLRLLASGPRTGLGEIRLPPVEPGSSIMPGKVNPSVCEAVNMVCLQVQGLDHAVAAACGAGQLELNTHMPLIGANALQEARLLSAAARTLADKCIAGIEADAETCRRHLERSAGLATLLNPRLGYDRVAGLVKESLASGKTLRELAVEQGLLTDAEVERLIASSTAPNL
ncbi:MAG TPA: aspartate ammonia-lyase, partial [Kiritimatiellia bacterium]|nr:aspartate ammonia-lyase [Kiritimatiellia bacterium]